MSSHKMTTCYSKLQIMGWGGEENMLRQKPS